MLYAIIGMLVIIADQWIKFWTAGHLTLNEEIRTIVPGILSLANVHNDGAAFGFLSGSGARIPFIIVAGVFTLAVIIALATKLISGRLARWSIVLVTAGALSNCLDRIIYGYVQDMFKLDFINFPVFNLADVFITVFAIVFALAVIFGKTHRDDDDYEFEDEEDEEEDEEDEPRVSRRKQRRLERQEAKRQERRRKMEEEDEEDEDEEEEDEPAPVKRKPKKAAAVRGRRGAKEEEPEEEEEAPAPVKKPARSAASSVQFADDPFADWDRPGTNAQANRPRAAAQNTAVSAQPAARQQQTAAGSAAAAARSASASGARPSTGARTAAPARTSAARPAVPSASSQRTASAAKPAAARPAPKPQVTEEFSLDDILNEFR